jgi:hypothetical protein
MKMLSAAAAVTLLAQTALVAPAFAAQPTLFGAYLLHMRTLCQASESIKQHGKKFQFDATSPGQISLAVGTISFMPSSDGALSGQVKASTSNADGGLVLTTVNGVTTGSPMTLTENNVLSGTYSINGNTVTIKFKGQPTLNFDSVYGQVDANAVAGTVDAATVSANPADCSTIVRLDRQ